LTGAFFPPNYFLAHTAGKSTDLLWWGYAAWRLDVLDADHSRQRILGDAAADPRKSRAISWARRAANEEARSVLTRLFGVATALAQSGGKFAPRSPRIMLRAYPTSSTRRRGPRAADPLGGGWPSRPSRQLVGINVVFYYGAVLWQAVGIQRSGLAQDQYF